MRPELEMTDARKPIAPLYVDEEFLQFQSHWRRFTVTFIAAISASMLLLGGFAEILISERLAPRRTSAVEAILIEPVTPKRAAPKPVAPRRRPAARRRNVARIRPRKPAAPPPPVPLDHRGPAALAGSTAGGIVTGRLTVPDEGEVGGEGVGSPGRGFSENLGARALYMPIPQIPDDLRENIFSAVAIARFIVDREGRVQVTLVKPTPNPRLNQIILDSLRTWKFFPAIKDGAPIASEFDVRIPIAVQ